MNFEYWGETRIKHERLQPLHPNSCRLSTISNAINYLSRRRVFSPEEILTLINQQRNDLGLSSIHLNNDTVTDEDVRRFMNNYGDEIGLMEIFGGKYLQLDFLDKLIESGFITAINHQLIYDLDIPESMSSNLVIGGTFSHQVFRDLYSFVSHKLNLIEEGHMDLILDVRKVNNVDCIILANLASRDNENLLAIPWSFFRDYLAFDWGGEQPIRDISQLPDEREIQQLMELGYLSRHQTDFYYGALEVYYPKNKRTILDAILLQLPKSRSKQLNLLK